MIAGTPNLFPGGTSATEDGAAAPAWNAGRQGKRVAFTVYVRPEPQGSTRAFIPKGWNRAVITSDNKKLKPYRQEVSGAALAQVFEKFGKHEPVVLELNFYLARPDGAPKKRTRPSVKPDLSKLIRSTEDALTGILYEDDAQIVEVKARKFYGTPERVEIAVWAA